MDLGKVNGKPSGKDSRCRCRRNVRDARDRQTAASRGSEEGDPALRMTVRGQDLSET